LEKSSKKNKKQVRAVVMLNWKRFRKMKNRTPKKKTTGKTVKEAERDGSVCQKTEKLHVAQTPPSPLLLMFSNPCDGQN
jgi:transcriptional regulator of acetoin/glycerol metabolism